MSTVGKQEHEKKRKENLHWECPHQIKLKKSGDSPLTNLGIPQGNKHPVKSPLRKKMNHIIFCRDNAIDETAFLRTPVIASAKVAKNTFSQKYFYKKRVATQIFLLRGNSFWLEGKKTQAMIPNSRNTFASDATARSTCSFV